MSQLPCSVELFPSASLVGDPMLYPGARPEVSYVTDGASVSEMQVVADNGGIEFAVVGADGNVWPLDEVLADAGAEPLAQRIPLLAYGANLSPGSLFKKMSKAGDVRPDLQLVPTVYARLPGHDVVWSGGPGVNGNFIAQLYDGPEVADTTVSVGVNLLTPEQVLMMHATELAYQLSSVEVEIGGRSIQAYMYAGEDSVHVRQEAPVAIESVTAKDRAIEAMSTRRLLGEILGISAVRNMLHDRYPGVSEDMLATAEGYVDLVRSLKPGESERQPRLQLKRAMAAKLGELGLVKPIDTLKAGQIYSWSNPLSLRPWGRQNGDSATEERCAAYQLPETVLPAAGWTENTAARTKILRAISTHTVRMNPELEIR